MTKHRKALLTSTVVLILCCIPIFYLSNLHRERVELDTKGFGKVPEFAIMFTNDQMGMTNEDTKVHHTVIVVSDDTCRLGCKELLSQMESLKSYYDEALRGNIADPNTPTPARFIVQSPYQWKKIPAGWSFSLVESDSTPYLLPAPVRDKTKPLFVLVDDNGFYRGAIGLKDLDLQKKLRTELQKMVSEKFLMHYVDRQALMWKKARGK